MNYIKHMGGFFDKAGEDHRLNATHVSLYLSIFQFWNSSRFHNPISISRSEVMKISKIASKATYHKCMRELNNYGYFSYQPSYNPFKGSLVYMFNFQDGIEKMRPDLTKIETGKDQTTPLKRTKLGSTLEQAVLRDRTKNGTRTEQVEEPYINSLNTIKLKTKENEYENTRANLPEHHFFEQAGEKNTDDAKPEDPTIKKEKLREKKKGEPGAGADLDRAASGFQRPVLQVVKEHFAFQNWPEQEAERFFNHYQSNGWLVAGKTPMRDWNASASNWMMNADIFKLQKNVRTLNAQVNTEKDYSEPL